MCASCCNYMGRSCSSRKMQEKGFGPLIGTKHLHSWDRWEASPQWSSFLSEKSESSQQTACGFFGTKITHQDSVFLHVSMCLTAILASFGQAPKLIYKKILPPETQQWYSCEVSSASMVYIMKYLRVEVNDKLSENHWRRWGPLDSV